jgi:hypothetical protein
VGVLAGYALGDRSGRTMPGNLDALIRRCRDYIDRESDAQTRTRHQADRAEAMRLTRDRDEMIHGLWTGAAHQVVQNRRARGHRPCPSRPDRARRAPLTIGGRQPVTDTQPVRTPHARTAVDVLRRVDSWLLRVFRTTASMLASPLVIK